MTLIGGEIRPALRARAIAAGGPGAAFENLGERQRCRVELQPLAQPSGQPVEQRDGQRAPFDHEGRGDVVLARGVGGIAQGQHAGVDEQPAIAVFGQAGEAVDIGHVDAGGLQRLDQRIGQPLRQLVQRHEAVGRVVGRQRRVPPAIAERDAAERQPRRPDRAEVAQQLRAGSPARRWRPSSASAARWSNRPPGTRRIAACRRHRASAATWSPRRRSRSARPSMPDQRIGVASTWKCRAQSIADVKFCSAPASARSGCAGSAENAPPANIARLASAKPFRAADRRSPVCGIAIAPASGRRRHRAAR